MIASGRILKELGYDGEFTIYYTFTVIEEDCDGLCWLYLIEKEGLKPDYIVSSEPTACRLFSGQRGRMEIEILLKGLSSHGSLPERGISAAYKASKAALVIEQLEADLQPDEDGFLGKGSVTVSMMNVTGPSQCSVPDEAIPGNLSTVYSGFCAQERLGGTYRKRMETGRMYTVDSAGGVTRESGKRFWN